jgi:hypothetical protein
MSLLSVPTPKMGLVFSQSNIPLADCGPWCPSYRARDQDSITGKLSQKLHVRGLSTLAGAGGDSTALQVFSGPFLLSASWILKIGIKTFSGTLVKPMCI